MIRLGHRTTASRGGWPQSPQAAPLSRPPLFRGEKILTPPAAVFYRGRGSFCLGIAGATAMVNVYELFGIPRDADERQIKAAYRELVRECHPDHRPDDPDAAEFFKLVQVAFETLTDPEARAEYDAYLDAFLEEQRLAREAHHREQQRRKARAAAWQAVRQTVARVITWPWATFSRAVRLSPEGKRVVLTSIAIAALTAGGFHLYTRENSAYVLFWVCYLGFAAVPCTGPWWGKRFTRHLVSPHPLTDIVFAWTWRLAVIAGAIHLSVGLPVGGWTAHLCFVTVLAVAGVGECLGILVDNALRKLYQKRGWSWPPRRMCCSEAADQLAYTVAILIVLAFPYWHSWAESRSYRSADPSGVRLLRIIEAEKRRTKPTERDKGQPSETGEPQWMLNLREALQKGKRATPEQAEQRPRSAP